MDCFDGKFLDELTERAKENPRLRQNYDLRDSAEDSSQRMLNAIEPGSEVPVHRHLESSETVVVIRGSIEQAIYDDNGEVVKRVLVGPKYGVYGFQIPKGEWHNTVSLESGTVIMEFKNGAYRG